MTTAQPPMPEIDFTRIGPSVGERFPDVVLPDQNGRSVDLHAARAGHRALVVFYRSASWWPFCKTQLVELQRSLPDFEREGIAVFAISYDPVGVLAGFAEAHGVTYPLLSDEGSRVIRELGLFNERVYEQHAVYGIARNERSWGVPYPGAFLLDEQGRVVEKRFQQSYRERETGVGLLEQGFHAASSLHGPSSQSGSEGVTVRAWLDSETYRFFQRLWLSVELQIAEGLHVYGRPIPEGYIPLSIEVTPIEGVTVGAPEWPEPHSFRVEGLDEQFMVYEGTLTVPLPVTLVLRDAGDQTLHVMVRYQACSAADCLLPNTVTLELPVRTAALVT